MLKTSFTKVVRVAKNEWDAATMAERPGGRRRSRRDSSDTLSGFARGTPSGSKDRRSKRSSKPTKERWLLTRKTWRYMADAGRRLIPEGTHNRPEDIPKIEQYFQEVCHKEPKFLLWRKASYPGTIGFRAHRRRRAIKGGSVRAKASSADEADDSRGSGSSLVALPYPGGKFDVIKVKRDWLLSSESGSTPTSPVALRKLSQEEAEAKALADMLQKYLNMKGDISGVTRSSMHSIPTDLEEVKEQPFDYHSLISKLQQHLDMIMAEGKRQETTKGTDNSSNANVPRSMVPYQGDYVHKSLLETLSRYYSKSMNRQHVISNILTDRKLLEKLYFDLRCTRGFRGPRVTGAYTSPSASRWWNQPGNRVTPKDSGSDWLSGKRDPASPPPLIAVQKPSTDKGAVEQVVQTIPVPRQVLEALILEREKEESHKEAHKSTGRRRSSVDNDDISPSVSDTIKRYLRMARKKSIDADKADRFKRVNYDRNLRNIKAKGEITKPGDDDGNNKGCQTEENWMLNYREMSSCEIGENLSDAETTTSPASRNASSRSSIDAGLGSEDAPLTPKHHQSFLSHFLHGSNTHKDKPHSAPGSPALTSPTSIGGAAMQKSKSSSSVVHHGSRLVAKKIWKSRSKSSSRAVHQPSTWTPQVSSSSLSKFLSGVQITIRRFL